MPLVFFLCLFAIFAFWLVKPTGPVASVVYGFIVVAPLALATYLYLRLKGLV